jgi:pilus assembly protein Flp/PilA
MRIAKFCADETGATSIEYALIASIVSVCIIAGATAIGGSLNGIFLSLVPAFK